MLAATGRARGTDSRRAAWLVLLVFTASCVSLTPYEDLLLEIEPDRLVSVDGRRVYVEDRGAGEPVVLLHGFGASSYSWRLVGEELARDFRVVAVDLSGFGFTERPERKAAYTRHAQGELVLAVIDALGIERVHLVGHSYGGSVSVALAARRPERLRSLTLVDSAAPDYPQRRRTVAAAWRPLTALYVRTVALRRSRIARGLRRSTASDAVVSARLIDEYRRRLTVEGSPRAFWGLTAPATDPQEPFALSDLEMPTLAVWGAEDALIPAASARRTAAAVPAGRFVVLDGVGHLPMEERPGKLADVLRRFFRRGLDAFRRDPER